MNHGQNHENMAHDRDEASISMWIPCSSWEFRAFANDLHVLKRLAVPNDQSTCAHVGYITHVGHNPEMGWLSSNGNNPEIMMSCLLGRLKDIPKMFLWPGVSVVGKDVKLFY